MNNYFIFIQKSLDKVYNYARIRYIIQKEKVERSMAYQDSFVKEIDFTKEELLNLIDLGLKFKSLKKEKIPHKYLEGLNIALIFEKNKYTNTFCVYSGWSRPRNECDLSWQQ